MTNNNSKLSSSIFLTILIGIVTLNALFSVGISSKIASGNLELYEKSPNEEYDSLLKDSSPLLANKELQTSEYHPSRIIVKLKDRTAISSNGLGGYASVNPKFVSFKSKSVETILENNNVKSIKSLVPIGSKLVNLENRIFSIETDESRVTHLLKQLNSDQNVEYAEYDYSGIIQSLKDYGAYSNVVVRQFFPNDPLFKYQWSLHNDGLTGGLVNADINAPEAWAITLGNSNIIIGILDTGIDYSHEDLAQCAGDDCKLVQGYDFYNYDSDPFDDNGHGTAVAGVAVAIGNNYKGISGVCNKCRVMPLKICNRYGRCYFSHAISAIDYAVSHGAKVLTNSWGGTQFSQGLQEAIDEATANGVLVVASAGNYNRERLFYPAAMDNVLAVTATNFLDTKAWYSNFGHWVDLSAPGGDTSLDCNLPNMSAILSTGVHIKPECEIITKNGKYIGGLGTSMSAPLVAGTAGLIFSINDQYSPEEVYNLIKYSTDDISLTNKEFSLKMGSGRLNAHNALVGYYHDSVSYMTLQIQYLPIANLGHDVPGLRNGPAIEISTTPFYTGLILDSSNSREYWTDKVIQGMKKTKSILLYKDNTSHESTDVLLFYYSHTPGDIIYAGRLSTESIGTIRLGSLNYENTKSDDAQILLDFLDKSLTKQNIDQVKITLRFESLGSFSENITSYWNLVDGNSSSLISKSETNETKIINNLAYEYQGLEHSLSTLNDNFTTVYGTVVQSPKSNLLSEKLVISVPSDVYLNTPRMYSCKDSDSDKYPTFNYAKKGKLSINSCTASTNGLDCITNFKLVSDSCIDTKKVREYSCPGPSLDYAQPLVEVHSCDTRCINGACSISNMERRISKNHKLVGQV